MLLNFSVSNHLSIYDEQTISLIGTKLGGPHAPMPTDFRSDGVLPCAIIYGPNASGKSNLLIALMFMRNQVLHSHSRANNNGIPCRPFMLADDEPIKPTTMEISFVANNIRYDFGFVATPEAYIDEWLFSYPEGRRRKLYERHEQDVSFGSEMKGAKKMLVDFMRPTSLFISTATQNLHEELAPIRDFFESFYMSNQISVAQDLINATFKEGQIDPRSIEFLERIGTGVVDYKQTEIDIPETFKLMSKEFIGVLKKHMGDGEDFPDFPDDEKNYSIELAHKARNNKKIYFNTENESSGTRRLLLILNGIFKALDDGKLVIIDELDASLHTLAVESIITLFTDSTINTKGAQLIATTHDTNLMGSEKLRRDEIWFVEKDIYGASSYYSLAEIKSRKHEKFEEGYLQGRYGAVPSMSWLKYWRRD